MHLVSIRASVVRDAKDGWAQLFRQAALLFFKTGQDAANGVNLDLGHGFPPILFACISTVIGDEAALKSCWSIKGASGSKPCMYCQNVVLHHLGLHPHSDLDTSKLALETDDSVLQGARSLAEAFGTISRAQFEKMEKAPGIVHTGGPIAVTQMDWMHIYCVSGVFNTEGGFLMARLKDAGLRWQDLDAYLQTFQFPKQLRAKGTSGSQTLRGYDGGDIKCSASEALSVYPCFRPMLMQLVPPNAPLSTQEAVFSFYALADVLDLLVRDKQCGGVTPDQLEAAVKRHLRLRVAAYGPENQQPKVHYAMHLANMMKIQSVLTCWVHERKHKELKRFANDTHNANRTTGFEKSLLQMAALSQAESLQSFQVNSGICLVNPKPAEEAVAVHARAVAGGSALDAVQQASDAMLGPGRLCATQDVALAKVQGQQRIVEVWFHVSIDQVHFSVVSPWAPAAAPNAFKKADSPMFVPTADIERCCVWHPTNDPEVIIVVP